MLTQARTRSSVRQTIRDWVPFSAARMSVCRRRYKRMPLFQSATIRPNEGNAVIAFTRDISRVGVGLIHNVPLSLQQATMRLCKQNLRIQVDISLCNPCGDGWYTSYGCFTDMTRHVAKKLFVATTIRKLDPRVVFRHPFFSPVDIVMAETERENLSVFTRDISHSGVGLFHNQPLDRENVVINIPGGNDCLRASVEWCQPCGHGWYTSGARFDRASSKFLRDLT